jgi:hypothetical protein
MRNKMKQAWLAALCAGMMILAAGCTTEEKTSNSGTTGSASSTVTGTTVPAAPPPDSHPEKSSSPYSLQKDTPSGIISNPPPQPAPGTDKLDVPPDAIMQSVVYRSNKDATQLVKETFSHAKMASESKRALVIFDQLKKSGAGTVAAVPDYVQIQGITIADGVMTLNYNDGVTRLQGSTTETMFVDAVNKTMFENFPSVKKIKYQINGKDAKVLTQMSIDKGFNRK